MVLWVAPSCPHGAELSLASQNLVPEGGVHRGPWAGKAPQQAATAPPGARARTLVPWRSLPRDTNHNGSHAEAEREIWMKFSAAPREIGLDTSVRAPAPWAEGTLACDHCPTKWTLPARSWAAPTLPCTQDSSKGGHNCQQAVPRGCCRLAWLAASILGATSWWGVGSGEVES